jgi:hypothetical protein
MFIDGEPIPHFPLPLAVRLFYHVGLGVIRSVSKSILDCLTGFCEGFIQSGFCEFRNVTAIMGIFVVPKALRADNIGAFYKSTH